MSIEPLPDRLKKMIEAEPADQMPPQLQARLLSRLDASIDFAAVAAPATGARAQGVSSVASASALAKTGLATAIFVAGMTVGAVLHAKFSQSAPMQQVPAPALSASPASAPTAEPERGQVPPEVVVPSAPVKREHVRSPAAVTTTLDGERRLLEPARTALARGMTEQALALLQKHVEQFPNGELTEEREALLIQALGVSGNLDAARVKAEAFKARFPDSLLLPVVERALAQ